METKIEANLENLESLIPTSFYDNIPGLSKIQVENARTIIIKKLQSFIQKIKNEKQAFEIEREDAVKLSFDEHEIEECFSQLEQELTVVETPPFYSLEWNMLIPLTAPSSQSQNYFGQYFNVRKLDLIEHVINHCFGNTVCNGSFQPTRNAINKHVPGRICIVGINQIVEMDSEFSPAQEKKTISIQPSTAIREILKETHEIPKQITAILESTNSLTNEDIPQEEKKDQEEINKHQNSLELVSNNTRLLSIINTLKNNISTQQNGRQTIRNSEWKTNLFVEIENRLKLEDPQHTDINKYITEIRSVCAMKRNPLHFWSMPHSASEFDLLIKELNLDIGGSQNTL
ncbi:hypothetical protein [Legionella sp. WA2022007384]